MSSEQLENFEELGRRAVACKRWRWMPGMRWIRVRPAPLSTLVMRVAEYRPSGSWDVPAAALPDLTDPATLGCLLALVREARRLHDVGLEYDFGDHRWNGQEYWTDETPPRVIITLLAPASLVALLEGGE